MSKVALFTVSSAKVSEMIRSDRNQYTQACQAIWKDVFRTVAWFDVHTNTIHWTCEWDIWNIFRCSALERGQGPDFKQVLEKYIGGGTTTIEGHINPDGSVPGETKWRYTCAVRLDAVKCSDMTADQIMTKLQPTIERARGWLDDLFDPSKADNYRAIEANGRVKISWYIKPLKDVSVWQVRSAVKQLEGLLPTSFSVTSIEHESPSALYRGVEHTFHITIEGPKKDLCCEQPPTDPVSTTPNCACSHQPNMCITVTVPQVTKD